LTVLFYQFIKTNISIEDVVHMISEFNLRNLCEIFDLTDRMLLSIKLKKL